MNRRHFVGLVAGAVALPLVGCSPKVPTAADSNKLSGPAQPTVIPASPSHPSLLDGVQDPAYADMARIYLRWWAKELDTIAGYSASRPDFSAPSLIIGEEHIAYEFFKELSVIAREFKPRAMGMEFFPDGAPIITRFNDGSASIDEIVKYHLDIKTGVPYYRGKDPGLGGFFRTLRDNGVTLAGLEPYTMNDAEDKYWNAFGDDRSRILQEDMQYRFKFMADVAERIQNSSGRAMFLVGAGHVSSAFESYLSPRAGIASLYWTQRTPSWILSDPQKYRKDFHNEESWRGVEDRTVIYGEPATYTIGGRIPYAHRMLVQEKGELINDSVSLVETLSETLGQFVDEKNMKQVIDSMPPQEYSDGYRRAAGAHFLAEEITLVAVALDKVLARPAYASDVSRIAGQHLVVEGGSNLVPLFPKSI